MVLQRIDLEFFSSFFSVTLAVAGLMFVVLRRVWPGVPWVHNQCAFWCILDFLGDMHQESLGTTRARRRIKFLGMSG